MHSRFLPLAGLLLATAAHAQDGAVQVYGRLNVALEHADSTPASTRSIRRRPAT